ncbi:MAG: IS110 family transposase, partial [Nitrospirae bacterium]
MQDERGRTVEEGRIEHRRGSIRDFLSRWPEGSYVAVEATANWYWIVDEIEEAGMVPRLVDPSKAKLMIGAVHKTDKLDAKGLNRLQRSGTLPEIWIPPGEIRDKRELLRARMALRRHCTAIKNRIH